MILIVLALVLISAFPLSIRRRDVRIERKLISSNPQDRREGVKEAIKTNPKRFAPNILALTQVETDPEMLDNMALELLTTPWRWSTSLDHFRMGIWAFRWAQYRSISYDSALSGIGINPDLSGS